MKDWRPYGNGTGFWRMPSGRLWIAGEATAILETNISDPDSRSHSVTTIRAGAPYGLQLRRWTEDNAGLTLGIGLGMGTDEDPDSTSCFRIGHMGHLNPHMVLGALASIEAGFAAIGYRRGSGAVDAAARVCAEGCRPLQPEITLRLPAAPAPAGKHWLHFRNSPGVAVLFNNRFGRAPHKSRLASLPWMALIFSSVPVKRLSQPGAFSLKVNDICPMPGRRFHLRLRS